MVKFDEISSYELARYQDKLTVMMSKMHIVCVQNNLTYYLSYGSCLGAVRHDGFIPWDDDFDIMMPRSDYEKLWKIWNSQYSGNGLIMCRTTREKCIKFHIMQLRDANTTFVFPHSVGLDVCHGIKIDIVPIDGVPENEISKKIQKINTLIFGLFAAQRIPNVEGGKYSKILAKLLLSIVKSNSIRYKLWSNAEKSLSKYDYEKTEYVRTLNAPTLKKSILGNPTLHKFGDYEFYIPENYDEYLKWCYNDYMQFPPLEERKPSITFLEYFDLDTPYKEYLLNYSTNS